jgi:hypothetical protein
MVVSSTLYIKESSTLYIKEEKENTATNNIEKNYYRVAKKTTS